MKFVSIKQCDDCSIKSACINYVKGTGCNIKTIKHEAECPLCKSAIDSIGEGAEWDEWEASEGYWVVKGSEKYECYKCHKTLIISLSGTQTGHPDIGNPIENIEVMEITHD